MNAPTRCPSCQADLPAASSFCPECGRPVLAGDAGGAGLATIGGLETIGGGTTRNPRRDREPDADAGLEPGTRFGGRYTITGRIGAGGMGVVYRAEDAVAGHVVALKLIRPDRLQNPADVQRLIREGVTARGVRHKNVVAVHDVGEADGQVFLSMEFLDGTSLRAWQRARKQRGQDVPFEVAARIVREVLAGLEAAHEQGVVHRDLKPENVVLLGEPSAAAAPLKIVDFGIARVARGAAAQAAGSGSGTGSSIGTPQYMAPEQVTDADLADATADLYSLSVMFYELLVGVLPLGHWQPPSGGRSDVPRGIDELVQAGLSNRPASRPKSAREYLTRLDSAEPAGPGGDIVKRIERGLRWRLELPAAQQKRLKVALAVILALAVLGALFEEGGGCSAAPDWSQQPEHNFYGDGGIHESDDPKVPVAPPRRGARVAVEDLSGQWLDTLGIRYDVDVDPSGEFAGSTVLPNGLVVELRGRFTGRNVTYSVFSLGQLMGTGTGTWDGQRGVVYSTLGIDGSVTNGTFQAISYGD